MSADWDRPASQPRDPARLYLPGSECLFQIIGYEQRTPPQTEGTEPPAPDGFGNPQAPPATQPPTGTVPPETAPNTTLPPRPIFGQVDGGTTIPPDVLDPNAPLPSAPSGQLVRPCR